MESFTSYGTMFLNLIPKRFACNKNPITTVVMIYIMTRFFITSIDCYVC